jgi:hypothetical protein
MATIACGRLEGQLTGCLILIIQIALKRKIDGIKKSLPQKWDEYKTLWNNGFNLIDELHSYQAEASVLMSDMISHSDDRNLLAHALWRDFDQNAPGTMNISRMRKTKKVECGLEVFIMRLSIQHLCTIRDNANALSERLLKFGVLINEFAVSIVGPPSSNTRIL